MAKPDGMSSTWKPRLVKTPTPIMSATTMAVATITETVDPPPASRPGNAASPDPDTVIFGPRTGPRAPICPSCRLGPIGSSSVNRHLNGVYYRYQDTILGTLTGPAIPQIAKRSWQVPQSRHDFVLCFACREWGVFPEA